MNSLPPFCDSPQIRRFVPTSGRRSRGRSRSTRATDTGFDPKPPANPARRWTSHPERFLASMDVFAFPSWREGFGSVLLEAQAMGLPIVASDIAGVRDAVRFGESALPCNPGDDASIADALETLLGRPEMRARMGALGHIRAAKSFNKLRIEDLWVRLAVSVARNRRRPALPPLRRGPGEFGTGRSAAPVK